MAWSIRDAPALAFQAAPGRVTRSAARVHTSCAASDASTRETIAREKTHMAHLYVTLPRISTDQRDALVKNLTETMVNVLGLSSEVRRRLSIRLDQYEARDVARDGRPLDVSEHPLTHIDVFITELPFDQKRELVRHLTTALCDSLGFRSEQRDDVFITFHQFRPENIAVGGHLVAELAMV
jgi:phenylpyruvate tautomerase PptA (4-oxalocrotonate tautomerase family)